MTALRLVSGHRTNKHTETGLGMDEEGEEVICEAPKEAPKEAHRDFVVSGEKRDMTVASATLCSLVAFHWI
jgi:hypothetical protein